MKVVVAGPSKLAELIRDELEVETVACASSVEAVRHEIADCTPHDVVLVLMNGATAEIVTDLAGEGWQILNVGDRPIPGASFVELASCPPSTLCTMVETMLEELASLAPTPAVEAELPEAPLQPEEPFVQEVDESPLVVGEPDHREHALGKVIAVVSPKGGTGKSTLSLLMSLAIAEAYGDSRRVCIVDANPGQADGRKYLSLDAATTITALAARAEYEQGSPDVVGGVVTKVPGTPLHALLGPRFSEYNPEMITPALFRRAVGGLRQIYDLVVVDTPAAGEAMGIIEDFVLEEADRIVVVVDPNDITLSNVVEWLMDVTTPLAGGGLGADPQHVSIVLNQAEEKAGVGEQDVQVLLGQWDFAGSIPRLVELKRGMNASEEPADLLKILHGEMGDALRSVVAKVVDDESLAPKIKPQRGLLRRMTAALSL